MISWKKTMRRKKECMNASWLRSLRSSLRVELKKTAYLRFLMQTFSSGAVVPRAFSRRCVSEAGEVPPGALLGNGRLPKPEEKLSNSSGLVITVATDAEAVVESPASFAPLLASYPAGGG